MKVVMVFLLSLIPLAALASGDEDAAALKELRARIEKQAAELESLRAEVARLEAKHAESAPAKDVPMTTTSTPTVFTGIMQGWMVADSGAAADTFRVRRAELRFTGSTKSGLGWTVMIDPAKSLSQNNGAINQASRVLQDAYITLPMGGGATLMAGQYKIPITRDGLLPPGSVDLVERALFATDRARGGTYGDIRDIGVGVRGTVLTRLDYHFGLFNGLGETQNDVDKNDRKALVGRFVTRVSDALQLGASGAREGEARNRLGLEFQFTRGPLLLKGEWIRGRDDLLNRRGAYVHLGYRLTPKIEASGRFDTWDPNTARDDDASSVTERDAIAGLTLRLRDGLRVQGQASHKMFGGGVPSRNVVSINLETSW